MPDSVTLKESFMPKIKDPNPSLIKIENNKRNRINLDGNEDSSRRETL